MCVAINLAYPVYTHTCLQCMLRQRFISSWLQGNQQLRRRRTINKPSKALEHSATEAVVYCIKASYLLHWSRYCILLNYSHFLFTLNYSPHNYDIGNNSVKYKFYWYWSQKNELVRFKSVRINSNKNSKSN